MRHLTVLYLLAAALLGGHAAAQPATHEETPTTMTYRQIDGLALHAYVFRPATKSANGHPSAVLLFHGGGWAAGAPDWVFPAAQGFASAGMVAIPIEYRLSEGAVTPIEALADTCAAFRWARANAQELGIDPKRIAGYGVSAGAHLLASTVTVGCPSEGASKARPTPDALLLLSPPLDMAKDEWFHTLLRGRATSADYSPADHVKRSNPPTNIVIGAKDTLTPLSGAKRYCDRVTELGGECHLTVFEGLGHLLTRNLKNQESDYDPDPAARAAGTKSHLRLLAKLGFIDAKAAE